MQHVGIRQNDVGVPAGPRSLIGVAISIDNSFTDARQCEVTPGACLIVCQCFGRRQIQGAGIRERGSFVIHDGGDDRHGVSERLPRCGSRGDGNVRAGHGGLRRVDLVHPGGFDSLALPCGDRRGWDPRRPGSRRPGRGC